MTSDLDWDGLRSFLAVARAGRLTIAARQTGVDHSTLSRRIGALERSVGAKLFDRQVTGYALTTSGEQLLEAAQAMESLLVTASSAIAERRLAVAGTVRVGAPEGFGTRFLATRLAGLRAIHPLLEVQLVALPRILSLSKREADIAIGLARPQEARLRARTLTDYELGLYASRRYLEAHDPPETAAELPRHQMIGYISDLIYAPELDYLSLIGPELHTQFASSSLLAQEQATLAGHGLCVLPCFMAEAHGELIRILETSVSLRRTFWLILHADTAGRAAVRAVSDFIADCVAEARMQFLPSKEEGV